MNNNTSTTCAQNAVIVRELLKFCRAARSSGDSRLGMTYSKAINSIRSHPQPISNGQQALQLNGVGNFIAGKIDEILDFERTFQADFANQPSIQPQNFVPNHNQQPIFPQGGTPSDRNAVSTLNNSGNGASTFITSYPQSVADWLRELDFLCYFDGFLEAGYDNLLVCEQLNETDLEHIKVVTKPGHRKTILVASQELHQRRKNREMNGLPAIPVPRNSNSPPAVLNTALHQNHSDPSRNSASPPSAPSPTQRSDVSSLPIPKVVRTRNGGLIPKVTEDFIRSNSNDASYERGKQLFQAQGVVSLIIDGEQLKAEVQGITVHDPTYKILLEVNVQRERVSVATCTCPYDQEGWCKHILATLFSLQNSSDDCNNSQSSSQPDLPRDTSPTVMRRNVSGGTSNYNDYFPTSTSTTAPLPSNCSNSSSTTTNTNVTKKPRKNPPKKATSNDATQHCNNNNSTTTDNNTNSKPLEKNKNAKRYIPTFRSGGWALMLALHEASLADDYPGYLLKPALIEKAAPFSDHSFEKADNGWYSAWNSMKTLRAKGLVLKQKSPAQYSLSEEGIQMAKELHEKKNTPQKSIDLRQLSPKKNVPGKSMVPSDSTHTSPNADSGTDRPSEALDDAGIITVDIRDESRVPLSPRSGPQMDSDEEPLILNLKRNNNNANIANNNSSTNANKKRPLPDSNKENQNPVTTVPFADNNITIIDAGSPMSPTEPRNNINMIDLNNDRENSGNSQYKIEVVLILDNREIKKDDTRNLYKGLCHHGINCEKRNLELGDVLWIVKRTLGSFCEEVVLNYILERKKISDLFASLEDGRYTEQKFRLKKSGLKNPIYLIEGNSGLLERADIVENALSQTQLEGFFVQRTASEDETLQYLIMITKQIEDFYKRKRERQLGLSSGTNYGRLTSPETCFTFQEFSNQVSKSKNLTLSDLFAKQLLQLPHCTPEKVSEIVKLHGTPRLLLEAYKKESNEQERTDMLKNVDYGQSKKRKIGALSKVIAEFYVGDYVFRGI